MPPISTHRPGAMPLVYPQTSAIASVSGLGPVPIPVPESATAGGPPLRLPVTNSDAVRAPTAVGVKTTWRLQFAPAASDAPQVPLSEKSPLFGPPTSTADRFTADDPPLVSVTTCAAA